jgi:transcriptional regulator with XRE-family HTH domain
MSGRSRHHVDLGEAIRSRRRDLGISQEALADRIGIDRTYLSGIERGERNPSYTNLLRIASALRVPFSELQAAAEARSAQKQA